MLKKNSFEFITSMKILDNYVYKSMGVIKVAGSSRIRAVWLSYTYSIIHFMYAEFTLMRALSEMNLS